MEVGKIDGGEFLEVEIDGGDGFVEAGRLMGDGGFVEVEKIDGESLKTVLV